MMKSDQRHCARAHLWLFSSGIDADELDVNGDTLATSLTILLNAARNEGRAEAAALYLQTLEAQKTEAKHISGEFEIGHADQTGSYKIDQLDGLIEEVKKVG